MIFVNREYELSILDKKLKAFTKGIWLNTSHIAFLGLRRIGKTYLVKYFLESVKNSKKDVFTIFVDISKSTENIKYLCDSVIQEFAKSHSNSYIDIDLDIFFHEYLGGKLFSVFRDYNNETDNYYIFNKFLQLLTLISNKNKLVIVFDEFQDILKLSKLKGLKNIDSIFRSELQNQANIFYIITGSYPTILRDIISNPEKKLYSHFEIIDINNFTKESSIELISLFDTTLNHKQKVDLHRSCNGNPYLISLILEKVDLNLLGDFNKNIKNLLFDRKGAIYTHYEYILEESLGKIQDSILLKAILKEISLSSDGLTLTELANKIKYSPQQTSVGLKQLLKIDIIKQNNEKKWFFIDILFSYYISYSLGGVANYEFEKNDYYKEQIRILQSKLEKSLTNLGRTKEFELLYEIQKNSGKLWNGVQLPIISKIEKNYLTSNGDEIDIYLKDIEGRVWVFELKYKNKKIGNSEINKFTKKIKAYKYIFVSKSGYVENIADSTDVQLINIK